MIKESFFEQKSLPYNFIVGGCIRVNQNNGRYAWHRITHIYHWLTGKSVYRTTIITVELKADWTDGDHHVWPDKELQLRMLLVTAVMVNGIIGFKVAQWWEHDVLESFVEQYHVHLN